MSLLNRSAFQRLAEVRLGDARALLRSRRYDAAYYLAGYAVECALKSCIAKQTKRHDFPDKQHVLESYTHKLSSLIELALPKGVFDAETSQNADLLANWNIVITWREESRYRQNGRSKATAMVKAVTDPDNGVLQCIRKYW